MKIIKNFLPQDKFIKVKELITGDYFPWFYKSDTEIDGGYFCHSLFHNNQINSTLNYDCTKDIYEILKPISLIEVRANLFFSSLFNNKKAEWHTDYNHNNWTSILYLNTTNGGTEFKDNVNFVKAEENKMVIFKCNTLHRPLLSNGFEKRNILNFNYF